MKSQDIEETTIYNADNSEFTLLVYFKTGYTKGMKFHSGKQEKRRFGGLEVRDLRYALNRLVYLVEGKFADKYKTAIIYHNPTGREIMRYAYGVIKSKEPVKWSYTESGDVLFGISDKKISGEDVREHLKKMHGQMEFKV